MPCVRLIEDRSAGEQIVEAVQRIEADGGTVVQVVCLYGETVVVYEGTSVERRGHGRTRENP